MLNTSIGHPFRVRTEWFQFSHSSFGPFPLFSANDIAKLFAESTSVKQAGREDAQRGTLQQNDEEVRFHEQRDEEKLFWNQFSSANFQPFWMRRKQKVWREETILYHLLLLILFTLSQQNDIQFFQQKEHESLNKSGKPSQKLTVEGKGDGIDKRGNRKSRYNYDDVLYDRGVVEEGAVGRFCNVDIINRRTNDVAHSFPVRIYSLKFQYHIFCIPYFPPSPVIVSFAFYHRSGLISFPLCAMLRSLSPHSDLKVMKRLLLSCRPFWQIRSKHAL